MAEHMRIDAVGYKTQDFKKTLYCSAALECSICDTYLQTWNGVVFDLAIMTFTPLAACPLTSEMDNRRRGTKMAGN